MAEKLRGVGAAPGLAVGKAVRWRQETPHVTETDISDPEREIGRLEQAVEQARGQISRIRDIAAKRMGEGEAGVFDAHLAFLDDPAYTGEMKNRIRSKKKNAEAVCRDITEEMASLLASLDDEYMRARADDIRDVGNRLLLILTGQEPFDPSLLPAGSVVIAEELTPSDTARFPEGIAGMVTARGSRTAHAAIMARTLGIPAVLGLGEAIDSIRDGDTVVLDGDRGTVLVNPTADEEQSFRERIREQNDRYREALQLATADAVTPDGKRIHVLANIGSLHDIGPALKNHAEGVGLFRTEFLYLESSRWPTEEEQLKAYVRVLSAFGDRPVIIRTLDIGGDKDLPYHTMPKEENPFLGHRAIRFCLSRPDIFKTQLRALLRAAAHGNLWIMFPMVQSLQELRAAKQLLAECRTELEQEGISVPERIPVGIMIEVPAAAVIADQLAKEADFMSIGTNDLTQYTLAADRGNERVAGLYDAAHPAVLRLVRMTCRAAKKAGIPVGMCGELAGDPEMAELLVGLGLDELSMSASAIPSVKQRIRQVDTARAARLAEKALKLESAAEVRRLVRQEKNRKKP